MNDHDETASLTIVYNIFLIHEQYDRECEQEEKCADK